MKKEKAIIEYLEENDKRVCVYSTLGDVLEVCIDKQAFKSYDIVGEMILGEIHTFGDVDEEDPDSYDNIDDPVEEY